MFWFSSHSVCLNRVMRSNALLGPVSLPPSTGLNLKRMCVCKAHSKATHSKMCNVYAYLYVCVCVFSCSAHVRNSKKQFCVRVCE